ncbi:MAG: PTS sugar transporter subunit IIA [Brevibacillus sp.]|nr:PTS sugar transporter subunit IIA [Brevibacillus sp.]
MHGLLTPEHLLVLNQPCDRIGVLQRLGALLVKSGTVEQAYVDAVVAREGEYPTGLEIGEINVAIPHANTTSVCRSGIALGIVKPGVKFCSMAEPDKEILVQVVILLAAQKSELQLHVLEQIMEFIQDQGRLQTMLEAADEQELYTRLTQHLALGERQG